MNAQDVFLLAEKYHLDIVQDSIRFNESGLDFLVAFAEDKSGREWVLRIPRRDDVMARIHAEGRALRVIHDNVSFQVPVWTVYENDLIAYERLDGVPMGTIDHEAKDYIWEIDIEDLPEDYYSSLASVLSELHNVPVEQLEAAGVPVHSATEARASMKARMDKVKDYYGVGDGLWQRWQTWLNNDALWPEETGLMHGDVHAGHMMIDDKGRVTGLIDWTEVQVTDVSNDFVFHYKLFGEAGLETLIQYYKEAGGIHWPEMAAHIIELEGAYPLAIAEFAMVSGIEEYDEMARGALGV